MSSDSESSTSSSSSTPPSSASTLVASRRSNHSEVWEFFEREITYYTKAQIESFGPKSKIRKSARPDEESGRYKVDLAWCKRCTGKKACYNMASGSTTNLWTHYTDKHAPNLSIAMDKWNME
ncbi:hypothetical protein SAMD00019534_119220 [Acytostelium subglobosum LB1]|uniref:hypothetical protein n=1 Tax=Acytostelium subglobosum LB1 TaxID=1410327 RepID=UPI000644F2D6|nr:hypothetical protein SAMD00019534_119220 [Acytostelium subglobosum LB1]GAM28746.1 hypothetical protein SAMD00019534_119220 [Acytostelium subglobosum LB1]|eukprot:XP_012748301.1 hypothetical protein SAMD00019534_119220 [Acytostelium subglobosum LB1]